MFMYVYNIEFELVTNQKWRAFAMNGLQKWYVLVDFKVFQKYIDQFDSASGLFV